MRTLLLLALLALLASLAVAKKGSISNDLFEDDERDDIVKEEDDNDDSPLDLKVERRRNPCNQKKCHRGEVCVLDKKLKAKCVCRPDCNNKMNRLGDRYKVCSNKNDTYDSMCHLDRDHCLCKRKEDGCSRPATKKIMLEYYGACQEMAECSEAEAEQFPGRMKSWLFVVMEELDRRSQMPDYQDLLETAKEDSNHSMAVIWKFCDLDKDPQDRMVSRRELQYMVRSLKALELCLTPFLDRCDDNDDKKISLTEWGECLGIDHDKITDKCHKIKNKKGKRKE